MKDVPRKHPRHPRACPVDFHSHDVGELDLFNISEIDLDEVEGKLHAEGVRSILTLYLPRHQFFAFKELMNRYAVGRESGRYRHIVGIALEGPLLASHGGTPSRGVWQPTKTQWRQIASCGAQGLQYVVCSPDAFQIGDGRESESTPSLKWLMHTLLDGGVRPAPGHFRKSDPEQSARGLDCMLEIAAERGNCRLVTDHLFNDMPLNFRHCWRAKKRRQTRDRDLSNLKMHTWTLDNLDTQMGLVPARLIQAAREGLLKLCMNFDGEHVDLAISKRTVDLVGAENFLLMTDKFQSDFLAGKRLSRHQDNSLVYQQEGIVAGGSQSVSRQIHNMRSYGFSETDIHQISTLNPCELLGLSTPVPQQFSA